MGKHKFRLSDMIPNAWFFKLRDMRARASPRVPAPTTPTASRNGRAPITTSSSAPRNAAWLPHRASHYYTPRAGDLVLGSPLPLHHTKASDTQFPPRRWSRRHHHRRRSVKLAARSVSSSGGGRFVSSPVSTTGCRCGRRPEMVALEAPDTPPCRRDRFVGYSDDDDEDDGRDLKKPTVVAVRADDKLDSEVITSATEIIINLRAKNRPEMVLRPIVTKPARREPELEDKHVDIITNAVRRTTAPPVPEQQSKLNKPRRSSVSSARRLKTPANTARVVSVSSKKCNPAATSARSTTMPLPPPLAESFAVVKSSQDPRRDFQESMEEMIAVNRIRTAADLEDLLACYLALNAAEYHDLIVDVFEHIWATLTVTVTDIKM